MLITHPRIDLDQSLDELRHNALGLVAPGLLLIGFTWALANMMLNGIVTRGDIPALTLVVAMAIVLGIRPSSPSLACWLLFPALVLVHGLIVLFYPALPVLYMGIISIILLSSILGLWQAALGAVVLWATGTAVLLSIEPLTRSDVLFSLTFYVLATGSVWLAGLSLRTAVSWALTGWLRAQDALQEIRQRRAELHRSLRALEEATFRIERMNSELILARGQAEHARAEKARFVATVSHEIRGPLNLILGFSRLMALSPERYQHALPADYRADVATIYGSSKHLASLVDDILDMSQIEANRLPMIKEWVDLEKDVIPNALQIAQPLTDRKELELKVDLHGALPTLLIDQVRICQVMINLLTNAARFTEAGSILLRTKVEGARVVVSVSDTGPGISRENLDQLFGEFAQFTPGERVADKGSGLGLAISKQLIELHDGEIWAESKVGVGTTVSFALPLPGAKQTASARLKVDQRRPITHEQEHVIVVHEDPQIVRAFGRYLAGYHVTGLPSVKELPSAVEELYPRAVISMNSLSSSALEVLSKLDYDIPLITCGIPQGTSDTVTSGVLSYLVKPLSREMLLAAIGIIDRSSELTVLIVDDDPDAARLVEYTLQAVPQSFRILKALDGCQALEVMESDLPDIALVDMVMPGMSGEDLIAHMQNDERLKSVPVVVISARDPSERPMSIDLPLSVYRRNPLSISDGCRCLLSILEAVSPRYLAEIRSAQSRPERANTS